MIQQEKMKEIAHAIRTARFADDRQFKMFLKRK